MMYLVGALMPLALVIIGACLIAMGVQYPTRGELAIAGAILLSSVLISASIGQQTRGR